MPVRVLQCLLNILRSFDGGGANYYIFHLISHKGCNVARLVLSCVQKEG